jgi:hypothetical protein
LGLHTQPAKPTRQSLYFLIYGFEAILPTDVMWKSPAVEQYDEGVSEESRQVHIDSLKEAWWAALIQSARYLEGIQRYHDRNVKERSFNMGVSYGPPWAHYLSGYQDRLLGGPLGLPGLRYTVAEGVEDKDYGGEVLG